MNSKRMTLGVDASRSTRRHPTGVERYSTEIISALVTEAQNTKTGLRLYVPEWSSHFPKWLQKRLWLPRLWSVIRLSLEMLLDPPDVLFVPAHILPFFAPRRSVVTLHDIAYEHFPEAYSWRQRSYLRWSSRRALRRAQVIVPTQSVKEDLVACYGADASGIHVVPHGPLPLEKVSAKRSAEPMVFFVGRLESKKNLLTLLEAWAFLKDDFPKARLVLGGKDGYGAEAVHARLKAADLKGRVETLGYLSEERLSKLFRRAHCVVIPSHEEGFGFPVLQAFEAGTPLLCSKILALQEVAGDAALYFDPHSPQDLAKQLKRLLRQETLQRGLVKKGRQRLKDFSWKKAAKAVLRVIESNP